MLSATVDVSVTYKMILHFYFRLTERVSYVTICFYLLTRNCINLLVEGLNHGLQKDTGTFKGETHKI